MRPVAVDDFSRFKYLSNITFSPEGGSAALVVSEADRKNDGYRSYLYLRRNGRLEKLTSFGKERSFQYLDENTILFPGKREKDEEESGSVFYRIRLSGGEAEEAYRFPIRVSQLLPLPGGDLLLVGLTVPGFEDLYGGDPKKLAAYRKYRRENADYEEIEQLPWWRNGSSYTKGAYDSLYRYDAKKKKLERLSCLNENVSAVKLNEEKTEVYFMSAPVLPKLPYGDQQCLMRRRLADGKTECLFRSRKEAVLRGYSLGKSFILMRLADQTKHGRNTNSDFYRMEYAGGEPALLTAYGESLGSSVGADIRYGGGTSVKMDGDVCYFISTRMDGAYLFKLEEGKITRLTDRPGSTDCFDVCGGKILQIALYDMKGQELYDEKGRRLSRFNEALLRNRYVAVPEALNAPRDGYEVHGFVLKPFGYDPSKKYPVILDVHGGPKTVYGPVFYHEMQYWAGKGYFVIFCNPTGSDGRGAFADIRGKYGTVDYEDIMAFCDEALKAYPAMDESNFFETGGSYGGFMTNWIVGHTDRFRACASQRSISNWFSFYGVSDIGVGFGTDQCGCEPWDDPEKMWGHSPLKYADKAKTPTLFIHSFEDYRCPIDQGYQMFTALVRHGVESKMVCFRGENHELSRSGKPSHRLKRLNEITEWFEKHRI